MKYFRKLITYKKLAVFLAVGMFMRSTIAVGYMLETNPADGSFLSVIICEGSAGINAIAGIDDRDHYHGIHAHANADTKHDQASQDYPFSNCSFWTASSLSLFSDLFITDYQTLFLADEIIFYKNYCLTQLSNNTRFARAPPALT